MKRFCRAAQLVAFAGLSACAAEPTGEIDTALDAQAPVTASELGSGEFVIAAGEGWIPFEYRKAVEPGSALDFSKLAHRHAPAGKFGRVVAKGGHFEFEKEKNPYELQARLNMDMQLAGRVPIDDDYFYETYGIPKPANYDQLKQEQEARRQATLDALRNTQNGNGKDEDEDEPRDKKKPKGKKPEDKESKLFQALSDFFGFAPW